MSTDTESHLHESERFLCAQRAGRGVLLGSALYGFIDALIIAVLLGVFLLVITLVLSFSSSGWMYGLCFALAYAFVLWKRTTVWKHGLFRITSERILVGIPVGFFKTHERVIKWPQYQESHFERRTMTDYLTLTYSLCIRYGTADARQKVSFPSLRYAEDLKHYLDKIDSAVRHGNLSSIHSFVAKPRGKREETSESHE